MAVTVGARPLDISLDRAASLFASMVPTDDALTQITATALLVDAWRRVFVDALDEGDADVAVVASREWTHWCGVLDRLGTLFMIRGRPPAAGKD